MPDFFSRTRIFLLFLLSLCALAVAVWQWPSKTTPLAAAVPAATAILLQCNDLHAAVQASESALLQSAWKEVLQASPMATAFQQALEVEQLLQTDSLTCHLFTEQTLLAAFAAGENDPLNALFILDLSTNPRIDKTRTFNQLRQNATAYSFRGDAIFTIPVQGDKRLVFCFKDNLLLFASHPVQVEDGLLQLRERTNWWSDKINSLPCQITVRPEILASQLAPQMSPVFGQLPAILSGNLESLSIAWDAQGQVKASATARGFLQKMLQAKSGGTSDKLCSVLPANTALLTWFGVDNRQTLLDLFKTIQNSDFEDYILPWLGAEVAFVLTDPVSPGLQQDQFFVLAAQDTALARAKINAYGAATGVLKRYDYQTFTIIQFVRNTLIQPLSGEAQTFRNPACTLLGDYLIWAPSPDALEKLIDQYIVNQTLVNDVAFLQLRSGWSDAQSKSAFLLFNAAYLARVAPEIFAPDKPVSTTELWKTIAKAGFTAAHFTQNNASASIALYSQPSNVPTEIPGLVWKKMLAAEAVTGPFVIMSATIPGQYSILIQDAQHQLYCFDPQGNLRWRRTLDGRLLSNIYGASSPQTPFRYLGNTAGKVWLFNEDGSDATGFPVTLQSPATNGLIVVYFDENTPFTYFLACANGNAYGYDSYGRPFSGWNPQAGTGVVRQPFLHFQHDGKDFFAIVDVTGALSVFGRDGARRFPVRLLKGQTFSAPQLDVGLAAPRIVVSNERGLFQVCNLEGDLFNLQVGNPARVTQSGIVTPFSGTPRLAYSVLEGKNIVTAGYKGSVFSPFFTTVLPVPADTLFAGGTGQLGALLRDKRQIFLLDSQGQLRSDFPLAGSTPFTISSLGGKELVLLVGFERSIYVYKL